ncbi:helix-turn-helix domain-containing protein [Enterococcus sp. AZ012]|uniref:helix-turn-helix domain-containing protein n=1 Tax=Enterococcus sp. AZ012 TaxID=2774682 RepID=UPI003D2D25BA
MSVHKYDLMSDDLMTAPEASRKWGYEESYVRQMINKYPERIPPGEIRMFGKTLVITSGGMEKLTGRSLKEYWYFYIEKQQMIFKEVKYESYEDALERLMNEMKRQGSLTDVPEAMDDHSERIGIKLENGTILFITKKRQEMN